MAIFQKKESFVKQIAIYINNVDYQSAYSLAKEFVAMFPGEMVSHFMLAKAAFWSGYYEESVSEGKRAFTHAATPDFVPCVIVTASACYRLGRYKEGMAMLNGVKDKTEDLEKLRFIFAVAMDDAKAASSCMDELFRINKKVAEELLLRFL